MTQVQPCFEVDADSDRAGQLRIESPRLPGEWFTLWLPENIRRDLPGRIELPRPTSEVAADTAYAVMGMASSEQWRTVPWRRSEQGGVERTIRFDEGSVYASARPIGRELQLELTVTNGSSQRWLDCWAEVCLRLAPSASFADTNRGRTYGRVDGTWMALKDQPLATPDPCHNVYRPTPEVEFAERCIRDWWCDDLRVQLDHPLIAVANREDTAVVGIVFQPCAKYCNNLHAHMACIHSDPLLGDIAPGASHTVRGKVIYFAGSTARFIEEALTPGP
jgi:hypothetical protein